MLVKGGRVLLPNGEMRKCDLAAEAGVISAVGENVGGGKSLDLDGAYVFPGLIDIHTHGIGFNFLGECPLSDYAELEAKYGATSVFATLFDSPDNIEASLRRYVKDLESPRLAKQIPGFRLESPYLARTGAGQSKHLAPISQDITDRLLNAGQGHVKIWDISPDLDGAPEAISYLTRKGVLCTMAHTQASIPQAKLAVDAGMGSVTHLFDTFVVPEMVDPGVYPAGLIDYLLVEDRLVCEIVADGTHVHPLLVEQALRCKSTWRIAFVTDSNLGAGLPSGRYNIADWGEAEVNGANNGVRLVARDMGLAGSALTPVDAFRNAIRLFGLSFGEAARVCSETPARLLGLNKGTISVGKDADLTVLDENLEVLYTIAGGEVIYKHG
jgi:N-acetylglucosamine-6-phosphate deacetylase